MKKIYNENQIWGHESFSDSFVLTAIRIEALSERYLFKPAGISSASFKILAFIKSHPECSPTNIMDYLGGTKSNITQRLNFLEKSNLISSARFKDGDKRKIHVSLSPAGLDKIKSVMSSFKKNSIYLEKFFTNKELTSHYSFMKKMNLILNNCEQLITEKRVGVKKK